MHEGETDSLAFISCPATASMQAKNGLRESDVVAVLKKVPVKLGGGKTQVCSCCWGGCKHAEVTDIAAA
jgi:hypothetical protein